MLIYIYNVICFHTSFQDNRVRNFYANCTGYMGVGVGGSIWYIFRYIFIQVSMTIEYILCKLSGACGAREVGWGWWGGVGTGLSGEEHWYFLLHRLVRGKIVSTLNIEKVITTKITRKKCRPPSHTRPYRPLPNSPPPPPPPPTLLPAVKIPNIQHEIPCYVVGLHAWKCDNSCTPWFRACKWDNNIL